MYVYMSELQEDYFSQVDGAYKENAANKATNSNLQI